MAHGEERRVPPWELCVLLLLGSSSLYKGRWDEINPSPKPREEGAAAKEDGGSPSAPPNPNSLPSHAHGPLGPSKGGRLPPFVGFLLGEAHKGWAGLN